MNKDELFARAITSSIQENKDKIEALTKQIERLKKKNKNQQQELDQYKNNWGDLKKWLNEEKVNKYEIYYRMTIEDVLDKMKELEEDK